MINVYVSKSDSLLSVDWDKMPENAKAHIIEYGLKQKLNDAGSSATVKNLGPNEAAKQAKAAAENVLAALMRGDVTVRQAARQETLEEREFNKVFKSLCKANLGKDEDKWTLEALAEKLEKPVEALEEAINDVAAKKAVIRRREIEAKREAAAIQIEI